MECGGGGKDIPSCLPCPDCRVKPAGRLWRHGSYLKSFISVDASNISIRILRLCCSICTVTHACLFPCLVPGSSHSGEALGELITPYFFVEKSCERLGWEASPEEGKGHRQMVYRMVERLCQKREWIERFVEKQVQGSGESLWQRKEPEREEECPNAKKVRTKEKRAALTRVRALLEKLREQSGKEVGKLVGFLHEASMQLRAPFSLLSRAKVLVFMSPHDEGDGLF